MPKNRAVVTDSGVNFRTILLYGTGLIGSSLALALKRNLAGCRIFGVDSSDVLQRARDLNIVEQQDLPATELPDLTILSAPVGTILELMDRVPLSSPLVLDVGSTKVQICAKAERRGLRFIGGHPMTGLERSGPENASADLFRNAPFFLCSVATTPATLLTHMETLVREIGADPRRISAEEHDRLVAQLSHLPQMLSTLLGAHGEQPAELAGPGWRSLTRLAASPFHVWRDILKSSGALPMELRSFRDELNDLLNLIESGRIDAVEPLFAQANRRVAELKRE
jgi:prephenate dehydrogenase